MNERGHHRSIHSIFILAEEKGSRKEKHPRRDRSIKLPNLISLERTNVVNEFR